MEKKALQFISGEVKLLEAMKVKHGVVEFGEDRVGVAYNYNDLNRLIGRLGASGNVDLATDGVSFLRKVGEGMQRTESDIATLVRDYSLPTDLDMRGLAFTLCEPCTEGNSIKVGHFRSSVGDGGPIVSFTQALEAIVDSCQSKGMPSEVGIALLKQVLEADLPIDSPEQVQDIGAPIIIGVSIVRRPQEKAAEETPPAPPVTPTT